MFDEGPHVLSHTYSGTVRPEKSPEAVRDAVFSLSQQNPFSVCAIGTSSSQNVEKGWPATVSSGSRYTREEELHVPTIFTLQLSETDVKINRQDDVAFYSAATGALCRHMLETPGNFIDRLSQFPPLDIQLPLYNKPGTHFAWDGKLNEDAKKCQFIESTLAYTPQENESTAPEEQTWTLTTHSMSHGYVLIVNADFTFDTKKSLPARLKKGDSESLFSSTPDLFTKLNLAVHEEFHTFPVTQQLKPGQFVVQLSKAWGSMLGVDGGTGKSKETDKTKEMKYYREQIKSSVLSSITKKAKELDRAGEAPMTALMGAFTWVYSQKLRTVAERRTMIYEALAPLRGDNKPKFSDTYGEWRGRVKNLEQVFSKSPDIPNTTMKKHELFTDKGLQAANFDPNQDSPNTTLANHGDPGGSIAINIMRVPDIRELALYRAAELDFPSADEDRYQLLGKYGIHMLQTATELENGMRNTFTIMPTPSRQKSCWRIPYSAQVPISALQLNKQLSMIARKNTKADKNDAFVTTMRELFDQLPADRDATKILKALEVCSYHFEKLRAAEGLNTHRNRRWDRFWRIHLTNTHKNALQTILNRFLEKVTLSINSANLYDNNKAAKNLYQSVCQLPMAKVIAHNSLIRKAKPWTANRLEEIGRSIGCTGDELEMMNL